MPSTDAKTTTNDGSVLVGGEIEFGCCVFKFVHRMGDMFVSLVRISIGSTEPHCPLIVRRWSAG
jgi:hypothetical protein